MCINYRFRGEFYTTPRELKSGNKKFSFSDPKTGIEVGQLSIVQFKEDTEYSVSDFLQGGIQIGLNIGIDFTGSNGDPSSKSSLHYFNPKQPDNLNDYQQAILAIGNILLNYDDDKLVFQFYIRCQPTVLELTFGIQACRKVLAISSRFPVIFRSRQGTP